MAEARGMRLFVRGDRRHPEPRVMSLALQCFCRLSVSISAIGTLAKLPSVVTGEIRHWARAGEEGRRGLALLDLSFALESLDERPFIQAAALLLVMK